MMICHFKASGFKAPHSSGVTLHRLSAPAMFPSSNIVAHCLSLGMALIECLIRATPHSNQLRWGGGGDLSAGNVALLNIHKARKHFLSKYSWDEARFAILLDATPRLNVRVLFSKEPHKHILRGNIVLLWVWLLCERQRCSLI